MALVVGNATVATGMSRLVEAGLYADEIFKDGVTFTSQYDVSEAGQIQIEKYAPDLTLEPVTPGSNFTDSDYQNTVININCNNGFHASQKVPAYYEATMPTDVKMNQVLRTTENVRIVRQKSGIGVLVDEGTEFESKDPITADNVKAVALSMIEALTKKYAKPNVALITPEVYTAIVTHAGKEFTPILNDNINESGRIGTWLGILWITAPLLNSANLKYVQESGTSKAVDASSVEMVMYDFKAFSIIDKLNLLRVIDSEDFAGSKIQEELAVGFKVTNPDCVLVKKNA